MAQSLKVGLTTQVFFFFLKKDKKNNIILFDSNPEKTFTFHTHIGITFILTGGSQMTPQAVTQIQFSKIYSPLTKGEPLTSETTPAWPVLKP